MSNPAGVLCRELERRVREESRLGWDRARRLWAKPLPERVETGRAIGWLTIANQRVAHGTHIIDFHPSERDMALFREGDRLRMSLNDPDGNDHFAATFLGLGGNGLSVSVPADIPIVARDGWSLDEDVVDLSDLYLRALDELATTAHGREAVLPALLDGRGDEIDFGLQDEIKDTLAGMDESQADAVATCLAAERFHLVQGPPGTGKTHTVARLVEELVNRGQRVLVTAFTHRAIHHALRKVASLVECPIYKVSDFFPNDAENVNFKESFAATGLLDHPGPYVIGATPFALVSFRLQEARFDVAVIDETSQMRTEAAIMPMLRAQRWFFFGDQQQLPPVMQSRTNDSAESSVFTNLKGRDNFTMLNTTYRLNEPLTRWPSRNFYNGELQAALGNKCHRFRGKADASRHDVLGPEPSMASSMIAHEGRRIVSDEEADEVAELIGQMLDSGVSPQEIGVVVPFRAQAARLRNLLRMDRFAAVDGIHELLVDTVERFQGQEREAMIVSFVVSDLDFMDRIRSFLTSPQRLNVAVTRARTKVVLVHSLKFHDWLRSNSAHDENAAIALSLLDAAAARNC